MISNADRKLKKRMPPSSPPRPRGVSLYAYIALALLLVLPVYALIRFATWIDWRILLGAALAISVFTFFLYRSDKQSAVDGEWRIPEVMLHFFELIGGWPGAFLAQRIVRHKISKTSYQVLYWAIVLIHQFVALEFVLGWRLTKGAWHFLKTYNS
jgi:uncharacterized membrane protein YsdA (DUF1294 family)